MAPPPVGPGRDRRATAVAAAAVRGEGGGGPCGGGPGDCVDGCDAYANADARQCRRGGGGEICLGMEALYRPEVLYTDRVAWVESMVQSRSEWLGLSLLGGTEINLL